MAVSKNAPKRGALPAEGSTGAEYEVLKTSHINGRVVHAGAVVKYDGVPGRFLRPLNAAAEAAKKQATAIKAEARDAIVKTESIDGHREAQRKLRAMDDERRGVGESANVKSEPALSAAEQAELQKAADTTKEQSLAASQEAGGVLLQLGGTAPETVIPTDGTGVANAQDQKAATVAKGAAAKK